MAYDPYSAGQYDYYQDPYQNYGYGYGYDGYGFEEPYLPPNPDKNWVDPVKVNREYLKKIQKSCVRKGFEGLKEDGLFLFEVMARSVSLRKELFENLKSADKKDKLFMTFVKILDTPFVEVNEAEKASGNRTSGEHRTASVLAYRKSFTNLFQSIYSSTGDHDSLIPDVEDKPDGGRGEEQSESGTKSVKLKTEEPIENTDTNVEETEKIAIMKGKSVLIPMPGLSMIQKMQQYSLIFKVTQCDVTDEDNIVEGDIIATAFIRLPETFRKVVLLSCKSKTVLPLVAVTTDTHHLMDPQGWQVGEAELTLVLTCFGKGAVNCVTEADDSHAYDHTFLLRHLKAKHVVAGDSSCPAVDPRLAKEILKLGLFLPSEKTSSEVLQHCISSNLIPTEEDERKHVQNKRDCGWFHMVKKARPSSTHSFDFERYVKEMQIENAKLSMKHKKVCRDLKTQAQHESRKSLDDRFREVQVVQTGVTGVETQNPFEELARHSVNVLSSKSFTSNTSFTESLKK